VSESPNFWDAVFEIRLFDQSYAEDAYAFVVEALEHTIRGIGVERHVSGAELVGGVCACAKGRFGLLAWTVLERWGIRSTGDVGAIVFQLIDAGVLSRQESDSRADFDDLFDLRVVLEDQYFDAPPAGAQDSA
jgi:uncharacterized repeat protein (TIGR04138 family)